VAKFGTAILTLGFLTLAIVAGNAADIDLLAANGSRLFVNPLIPVFERTTNHRVTAKFEEPGIHRKAALAGDAFDLIILPAGWEEIRAKIIGNPVGIAHTQFGFLVRADSPMPDTGSADAVKRALLAAKSIVYTDPKTGAINGVLFARMLERLGIADEVNRKSKIVTGPPVEFLAKGEVDLAVALSIGVVDFPNVRFVPMPPEFQATVTFSGAISGAAKQPVASKALLEFLIGPGAVPIIKAKGYEPG
jgi:molybdate transport system substrate-binding protein